jgi:hypothetical protein
MSSADAELQRFIATLFSNCMVSSPELMQYFLESGFYDGVHRSLEVFCVPS